MGLINGFCWKKNNQTYKTELDFQNLGISKPISNSNLILFHFQTQNFQNISPLQLIFLWRGHPYIGNYHMEHI